MIICNRKKNLKKKLKKIFSVFKLVKKYQILPVRKGKDKNLYLQLFHTVFPA